MGVDKKILEQYVDACEMIRETEQDIKRLQRKRQTIATGSVKGSMNDFPYAETHFKIEGTSFTYTDDTQLRMEEKLLEERKAQSEEIKLQVEQWMNGIPVRMQRIIRYKFFEGMSWERVADRIVRLLSIADKAAEKAEQALGELEQYVVRDKKKVKTVEYKDNTAIGKPTKEIIDETERINIASGPIDRLGLSQVTGALKNLKEIYMIPAALEKQSAETALLKAKVQTDDEEETADDGFLEALQGSAAEDWMDEEN